MADVRLTATNPEDSSVVPVACDASGRLLLQDLPEFDGTVDGDLYVTGKGTFAGGKSIIGNDGSAQFAQGAVDIYANGTVEFTQNVSFAGSATFADLVLAKQFGATERIYCGPFGGSDSNNALEVNNSADQVVAAIKGTGSAEFSSEVQVRNLNANFRQERTGPVFQGYAGTASEDPALWTSQINSDGSATFADDITCSRAYTQRLDIGKNGYIPGGNALTITNGDDVTATLIADGSVIFAGNKAGFTAEGYLWCTTRRGDTVILDATSNGLASWVEYTPTSRFDEIRDKLDANRGDTGEMPADTP